MPTPREAFDQKAYEWEDYTKTPLGHLRELLNYRYLQPHLPPAPVQILDAGCGTGGLGVLLAKEGYQVHLLDLSKTMLSIAHEKATTAGVLDQIQFYADDINRATLPQTYDVVICHTLLEYIPDIPETLQKLATLLNSDGVLSLVFVNRYADVLKQAFIKGNIRASRDSLEAHSSSADLFGVPRQTFDSDTVQKLLTSAGLSIKAEYGVRIFADHLNVDDWRTNPGFEDLLSLEMEASQQFPFKHIGRYGQLICHL